MKTQGKKNWIIFFVVFLTLQNAGITEASTDLPTQKNYIYSISMKTQDVGGAGTDSPISVTICQDNRCCKTGNIESDHEQGQVIEYEGDMLGGCKGFSLTEVPVVKLKIQGTNEWYGDWIKIFTGSKTYQGWNQGADVVCNVDVWLDDNEEITLSCSKLPLNGLHISNTILLCNFF